MEKLIQKIVEKQIEYKTIKLEDINVYVYGYTLLFEVVINVIIALIIGILSGNLILICLFLCNYIPLRSFCGGWHADKLWKCTIYSNISLIIVIFLCKYIIYVFTYKVIIIVFGGCVCFILSCTPMDTDAKRITVDDKRKYKKSIIIIVIIHSVIIGIAYVARWRDTAFIIMCVYVLQMI